VVTADGLQEAGMLWPSRFALDETKQRSIAGIGDRCHINHS
jgi:hypothetical protein